MSPTALFRCLIMLLSVTPLAGSAEVFHVSSLVQARDSLDKANPGDTIILSNGTYGDFQVNITRDGLPGQLITFKAESGGKVIFKGVSGIQIQGDYVSVDGFRFNSVGNMGIEKEVVLFLGANASRLTNCAFYKCGFNKWAHIIQLEEGTRNSEVSHCYLEDIIGQGIGVIGKASIVNNRIHHNHINRTISDGEDNGQEPIQIGQNQRIQGETFNNTIVEYNLIENMQGDADPELISNKTAGNIIRYNTFLDNRAETNLTIRGGVNCIVESNYLKGSGIRLYGHGHVVRNNTIIDAPEGIFFPGGTDAGMASEYSETFDCLVEDNLLVGTTVNAFRIGGGNPGGPWVHNITIRNNTVKTDRGAVLYLHEANQGDNTSSGNILEGSSQHVSGNIDSGIKEGTVDLGDQLSPLSPADVGPDWIK